MFLTNFFWTFLHKIINTNVKSAEEDILKIFDKI